MVSNMSFGLAFSGGGVKGAVEGYSVGGKTATSEKLPRGNGKYISSFTPRRTNNNEE